MSQEDKAVIDFMKEQERKNILKKYHEDNEKQRFLS